MSDFEKENREMKMLLRKITHEMANALTVMGYSIKSFEKNKQIKNDENWNYINKDFKYMCNLFMDLSDYNRSNNLCKKEVDLNILLKNTVNNCKSAYKDIDVEINYESYVNKAMVSVDEIKITQVIINLIKNACEAIRVCSSRTGYIKVQLDMKNEKYIVMINDNGCGIEKEMIDKIFEPMYTYNKEGGTGLGLSVSKNIMESHGGNIFVESGEGIGTKFIIEFPVNKKMSQPV